MALVPKHLSVHPPIVVSCRHLKRYHVTLRPPGEGGAVPPDVVAAAEAALPTLLPAVPDDTPPAGWTVLHQGADGGVYVNVYSWVWGNVVEVHFAAAAQPFLGCPDDDPTHFVVVDRPLVGCIWELPPFGHERDAWVRHVLEPDEPDLEAYLADTLPAGPAGPAGPAATAVATASRVG